MKRKSTVCEDRNAAVVVYPRLTSRPSRNLEALHKRDELTDREKYGIGRCKRWRMAQGRLL